jgi:hypothetical protein
MEFSASDAERVFGDGSYKSLSDEELRKLQLACINVGGPNLSAVGRIRAVGEGLGTELAERRKHRQEQERSGMLSADPETSLSPTSSTKSGESSTIWDELRLERLIQDGIEESSELEYKAAAAINRDGHFPSEITKDVSSMANGAGGTVIYGMAEFQDTGKSHLPERVDPIARGSYSKEWLEHIVGQIRPRIVNLKIYPVPLSSGPDDLAYVVEIPQGATAHQAKDCRYYRRYNFESVPMLDHEIRDVMNRKTQPHVSMRASFVEYPRQNSDGDAGALVINIRNDSDILARYVGIAVNAPIRFKQRLIAYKDMIMDSGPDGTTYRFGFSNHNGAPLFPGATMKVLFKFHFIVRMEPQPERDASNFRFVLFADSMPKQEGTFSYAEIESEHGSGDLAPP